MNTLPSEILKEIFLFSIDYSTINNIKESMRKLVTCNRWRTLIKGLLPRISSIFGVDIMNPVRMVRIKSPVTEHNYWNKYTVIIKRKDGDEFSIKLEKDSDIVLVVVGQVCDILSSENYICFHCKEYIIVCDLLLNVCKYSFPSTMVDRVISEMDLIETSIGLMLIINRQNTYDRIYRLSDDKCTEIYICDTEDLFYITGVTHDYLVSTGPDYRMLIDHKTQKKHRISKLQATGFVRASYGDKVVMSSFAQSNGNAIIVQSLVYDLSSDCIINSFSSGI